MSMTPDEFITRLMEKRKNVSAAALDRMWHMPFADAVLDLLAEKKSITAEDIRRKLRETADAATANPSVRRMFLAAIGMMEDLPKD